MKKFDTHAWVIVNKDFDTYVHRRSFYTDNLNDADIFLTRKQARDFIKEYETVDIEMPIKVYYLNGGLVKVMPKKGKSRNILFK